MSGSSQIPHVRIVVAVCCYVFAGWSLISAWALFLSGDVSLQGTVISTWQNFSMLAVGFWLGSSSGGKSNGIPNTTVSETRLVGQAEQTTRVVSTDTATSGVGIRGNQGDEPSNGPAS